MRLWHLPCYTTVLHSQGMPVRIGSLVGPSYHRRSVVDPKPNRPVSPALHTPREVPKQPLPLLVHNQQQQVHQLLTKVFKVFIQKPLETAAARTSLAGRGVMNLRSAELGPD